MHFRQANGNFETSFDTQVWKLLSPFYLWNGYCFLKLTFSLLINGDAVFLPWMNNKVVRQKVDSCWEMWDVQERPTVCYDLVYLLNKNTISTITLIRGLYSFWNMYESFGYFLLHIAFELVILFKKIFTVRVHSSPLKLVFENDNMNLIKLNVVYFLTCGLHISKS